MSCKYECMCIVIVAMNLVQLKSFRIPVSQYKNIYICRIYFKSNKTCLYMCNFILFCKH